MRDEYGNVYYGIDEDMRDRLQAKLMRAVLDYKIEMCIRDRCIRKRKPPKQN